MANSKTTKKALLSSALALTMCVAMLIATTFAWFTDTASTSVNKIQAGTLDVGLEMLTQAAGEDTATWKDAEGQTLSFKKATDGANQDVLWEPGCTYELPAVRVVNKGNLAFKYKIAITGATGDTKLLDVIKFTVKFNDKEINIDNWEGMLLPEGKTKANDVEEVLNSSNIVISGHMDENAGNEYQGLSVSGIGITVYATQYTYEYDSYDNQYDANAESVAVNSPFNDYVKVTGTKATSGSTVIKDSNTDPTITATLPENSLAEGITNIALIKKPTANPDSVKVDTGNSALTTDVKIIDTATNQVVTAEGDTYFTIDIQLGKVDLKEFYHKGVKLTEVDNREGLTSAGLYCYSFDSGIVTFTTKDFSTFTAVFKFAGGDGTESYPYLIATKGHFAAINDEYTSGKFAYYKIVNSVDTLDLSDVGQVRLYGVFDGNNKTITTNQNLFRTVGIGSGAQNVSVIKNVNATVDHSSNALIFETYSPEMTFDNVNISGIFEGYWNMAAFVSYGSANHTDVGFDYTLNFTNCSCNAKIFSKQNGNAAVLIGHTYSNPGKATIKVDSATKTGISDAEIYAVSNNKYGCLYYGNYSTEVGVLVDNVEVSNVYNGQKITATEIPYNTINKVDGAYTLTPGTNTATVRATVTAQLTAYDNDNYEIENLSGITFTLSPGTTYTASSGKAIELFKAFDAVEIVNELTDSDKPEYKIVEENGSKTLTVYTNSTEKYITGYVRITATEYDASGNVSSAGTKDIANSTGTPNGGTVTWTVN